MKKKIKPQRIQCNLCGETMTDFDLFMVGHKCNPERELAYWREKNEAIGRLLGYPECCIDEFCKQSPLVLQAQKKLSQNDIDRYSAAHLNGVYTGFIPCTKHAKQILNGEISILDLISDSRSNEYPPFPFL